MTYKCNECEARFDVPDEWRETRGEFWGVIAYESMIGCPYCYSTDFEEMKERE